MIFVPTRSICKGPFRGVGRSGSDPGSHSRKGNLALNQQQRQQGAGWTDALSTLPNDVSDRRNDYHAAKIPRYLNCHVLLPLIKRFSSRVFQRLVRSRSTLDAQRYRREWRVASATPGLRGVSSHLRRAPAAFIPRANICLCPVCPGAEAPLQFNPNGIGTLRDFRQIALRQAEATIADINRWGRNPISAACLVASLAICQRSNCLAAGEGASRGDIV